MSFSIHLGYNSLLLYMGGGGGGGGGEYHPISKVNIFMNALLVISIFKTSYVVCEHNIL